MRPHACRSDAPRMQRNTTSDGLRISFDDSGSGSPAVVLIHGSFGSGSHYAALADHLRARHRVLIPDVRGHGASDTPAGAFGLREAARDVLAVCDEADVDRAVLIGHSWPVALEVAAQRPALVAGVALLDGTVLQPLQLRTKLLDELVPVLEGPAWADAMRQFFGTRAFTPYDSPATRARVMDEIGAAPPAFAAQMMREVMSSDHAERLTLGTWPLLYVHGTVPADLARLRELRPDAIIAAVAAAGHWMMLEVPDQLTAMLDRLLEIVARRERSGSVAVAEAALAQS